MFDAIESSLNEFQAAVNIIQSITKKNSGTIISEDLLKLHTELLSAQQGVMAFQQHESNLTKGISQLETELVELKTWNLEKENMSFKM